MTVSRAVGRDPAVTPRSRTTLLTGPSVRRVVQALGTSLLALRAGEGGLDREITDVHILAPGDRPEVDPGALVLAVGSTTDEQVLELVEALVERGCAGVVVRSDEDLPRSLAAAGRGALPFLALGAEAAWTRIAEVVTGALTGARGDGGSSDATGLPWGDLFSLANAISTLLDSPITIEDPFSRVLAFSGRQDETDEGRVQTILGRRVPEHYLRLLEERGVFRALRSSRAPVFVEALSATIKPRVAIGIFAGDEPLGSIWAVTGSLTPDRARALTESAQIAALHLLRLRVSSDVGRRLQSDLVAGMLEGGSRAEAAGARLFPQAAGVRVLAVAPLSPDPDTATGAAGERSLHHLRDAVAMHFSAGTPRAAAAVLGGVVYVVLPADRDDPAVDATARTLATGLGHSWDVAIAIGPPVAAHRDLPASRAEADHVLRVLRAESGRGGRRVARLADVRVSSLLLGIADLDEVGQRLAAGPVEALERYDRENRADLLATLEVFLESWGTVQQAATRLHIHQNTLRYRVSRACEIAGIDLADPDERLAITLALRLRRFRADAAPATAPAPAEGRSR